jgi:hypothetical protein
MNPRTPHPVTLAALAGGLSLCAVLGARGAPVDPRPGSFLPAAGARPVWGFLETLDAAEGTGTAQSEADGKTVTFRLLPYTAFWRFGAPNALPEEYRKGDRLRLKLAPVRSDLYALEIRDEISVQAEEERLYRMESRDGDNYRFTVEALDARTGQPLPERLTLEYGRGTFLVLREDPVYMFRPAAGTRLRINTARNPGQELRIAREVLDDASFTRFRRQEELRAIARADAHGATGYLVANGSAGARVVLFPGWEQWAARLRAGDEVRVGTATARVKTPGRTLLLLDRPLPGAKVNTRVAVTPVRSGVSYERDIGPILEVNCLFCHRQGNVQGGYTMSDPERMRAGGRRGPGIVPGKSTESMLYLTMSRDRNPPMPPDRYATPEQLALIKAWIDAGAEMPGGR